MTALPAVLATTALAALVVLAGYAATPPLLAAAVGLTVLVLALGWARLVNLPAPRGTGVAIVLTGWAAAALAVRAIGMTRPLAPFAALLALSVLVAFGHELSRRGGRSQLVESVTGTVSGQTLALLGGAWVLLPTTRLGLAALVTAVATTVGVRAAPLLGVPAPLGGWVALAVGIAVGAVSAVVVNAPRFPPLLLVAAVVAAVVAGLDQLLLYLSEGRGAPAVLAAGAAPVLAVGTAAYAVARLVA